MCGICGVIDFDKSIAPVSFKKMCDVLAHRGPDDEGMVLIRGERCLEIKKAENIDHFENSFEAALGHRRLSIIDLSEAGHQPMCNEDRTVWIVFNGEIYNFKDLRKVLEKTGHRFKSNSDTEVILHAYEEWGTDCLERFRGMFAFAIWDSKQKQLFMARDRLGKKPLVYFKQNGQLCFASEIKSLLQVPGIDKKVNFNAIHNYLTYQYVPSPDTIFEGIKKLPPAHFLLYDQQGSMRIERYWKLQYNSNHRKGIDLHEIQDRIRIELEEAVKLRLISDVPLGAFLSGGIDSSLIVGIMAKLVGQPVKTFSIGFEEKDFDELRYARMVAEHFSTDHHEFIVKPDAIEILPKLVWYFNEPFADSSAIPTYYVSKMTRDYVTVVLTGDAGDENFAGYYRYLRSKWVALFSKTPDKIRKVILHGFLRRMAQLRWKSKKINRLANYIESISSSQAKNYAEQIKIFNAKEKEQIYSPEFSQTVGRIDSIEYLVGKYEEAETDDLIDQLLYLDINTYLPEDLLVKVDIATMANSLEARVPFLDHHFMEFVASIPSQLKLRGSVTKYVLKEAYAHFVPQDILKRKKMGFGVPVSKWFRNELQDYTREVLLNRRFLERGIFKREGVERLLKQHSEGRYDHSSQIWALLFLEMWFRVFIDKTGESNSYGL